MCALIILGGLILLLLVIFVKTALILLPWTMSAGILGGLSGFGLGKLLGRSRPSGIALTAVSTLSLTVAFGYLFYSLVPATAPPQKKGLEILLEAPEPKQEDLRQMLPVHLGIVSVLAALIAIQFWLRWSPVLPSPQQNVAKCDAASDRGTT